MSALRLCALRRPCAVLLGLLTILALAPTPVLADDGLAIGSTAAVTAGESLRTAPGFDAPVATEVAPGTEVTIADGPLTAPDGSLWYQVDVWGQLGYLPTYAVSASAGAPADASGGETTTSDPALEGSAPAAPAAPIGTVYILGTDGDGAACRADASYDATILATLPEGSTVEATGDAVGEWQPVNCGGAAGFVNLAYVSWEAPATETTSSEPVAESTAAEGERRGGGGGSGQAIADFAMQYVGYPYVYAGADPATGFDCSGFTMYVIQQTLGIDITHDMFTQAAMGTPVDQGSLQPGDLVFFQNTFRAGLSHAGIYVGGGQFVHAENESTGVKVSDINSDYYASRWYGATRLA